MAILTPQQRTIMNFQTWDAQNNAVFTLTKTYALEGEPLEVSARRKQFALAVEKYNSDTSNVAGMFAEYNGDVRAAKIKAVYAANKQRLYDELTALEKEVKTLLIQQQKKLKDILFPLSKDTVVGQLVISSAANLFDTVSDSSLGRKKFIFTPETLISQGQIDVLNYLIMFEETRDNRSPEDKSALDAAKKYIDEYLNASTFKTGIVYLERLQSEIHFTAWQFQESVNGIVLGLAERRLNDEFNVALNAAKGLA